MKKPNKKWLALIVVLPILALLLAGPRSNPAKERTVQWNAPRTATLFARACQDCHSYETRWPWYSKVAPVSWLVIRNVSKARSKFNISATRLGDADEAAKEVREDEMPPWDYQLAHPEARLTDSEKQELIAGLVATFGDEKENDHGRGAAQGDEDDDDDD